MPGDIDTPKIVYQWTSLDNFWARLCNTNNVRLTKRIPLWAAARANSSNKTRYTLVRTKMIECGFDNYVL